MEQQTHKKLAGGNIEATDKTLKEESTLLKLPDEVWLKILKKVSLSDLNSVALTNGSMSARSRDCSLWKKVKLKRGKLVGVKGIKDFFENPRFKLLETLSLPGGFSQMEVIQVLEHCQKSTTLKELDLNFFFEIEHVPAALLASVVAKMEIVAIPGIMKPDQIVAIFGAAEESTTLYDLDVWFQHDLSVISSESLAKTMAKLRKVCFMGYQNGSLTADQISAIFDKIRGSVFLEELVMWRTDLSPVPSTHLSESKPNIRKIHLDNVTMTKWQVSALSELVEKSPYLQDLQLLMIDISSLPPLKLSRMMSNLTVLKLNLWSIQMSEDQITAILSALAENTSLLQLTLTKVNMTRVPTHFITKNAAKIQKLTLEEMTVTEDQLTKIFEALVENDSLVKLSMYQDLRKVSVELLTRLADKTTVLDFSCCKLTEEQKLIPFYD